MMSQIPLDLPHGNIKVFLNTGIFEVNIELFNQVLSVFTFLTRFLKELFNKKKAIKNRNVYERDMTYTFYGKKCKTCFKTSIFILFII